MPKVRQLKTRWCWSKIWEGPVAAPLGVLCDKAAMWLNNMGRSGEKEEQTYHVDAYLLVHSHRRWPAAFPLLLLVTIPTPEQGSSDWQLPPVNLNYHHLLFSCTVNTPSLMALIRRTAVTPPPPPHPSAHRGTPTLSFTERNMLTLCYHFVVIYMGLFSWIKYE